MTSDEKKQFYNRLVDAFLTLKGDELEQAIAREIDFVPMPISEPDEQTQKARERARRELAFLQAEGNLAHEFGDNYDPGDHYREMRRMVIEGELTYEQAIERNLAHHRVAKTNKDADESSS